MTVARPERQVQAGEAERRDDAEPERERAAEPEHEREGAAEPERAAEPGPERERAAEPEPERERAAERQPSLRVAVLGIGLIGGSIGLAARARARARVTGWDPDPGVRARALELHAVDDCAADIPGAVAGADVVFVAAPVGALVQSVRAALDGAGPETVVTDVGSTKRAVAEAISDPRFIAGHPLAGAQVSGVEHARADLFEGAVWYLADADPRTRARARAPLPEERHALEDLIRALGAEPVAIDPELHDRLMATVSHLPHVLANLLVAQAVASLGEDLRAPLATGPSFRDATRVAGSNSEIWTDIYMSNRDPLVAALDELGGRLAQVRAILQAGDAEGLREWNERARAEREALPRADS
ncbi:MAG TPA: prephenate dehydrogenase/arogenate dehydrogenase family protein [Solirubrobacteraceae bacterium]|nr:prephenate dehydrogenase/arogenate dehydrogenase family protein [Solirubrobacteraceae bacterium]